ncbi:hypothetical protein L209DRAFT_447731 [Thermothelomyces heterothallicus CBS 203.75]
MGRKKSRYQVVPARQNHWGFPSGASALGAVKRFGVPVPPYPPRHAELDPRPPGILLAPRWCPAPASWPQRYPILGITFDLAMPDRFQILTRASLGLLSPLNAFPSFIFYRAYKRSIGLFSGRSWGSPGHQNGCAPRREGRDGDSRFFLSALALAIGTILRVRLLAVVCPTCGNISLSSGGCSRSRPGLRGARDFRGISCISRVGDDGAPHLDRR